MDLKYKFSAKEYSTLCGITPSALRKRRLSGKLEGQFIKKGSEYFYSSQETDRPNKDKFTVYLQTQKTVEGWLEQCNVWQINSSWIEVLSMERINYQKR